MFSKLWDNLIQFWPKSEIPELRQGALEIQQHAPELRQDAPVLSLMPWHYIKTPWIMARRPGIMARCPGIWSDAPALHQDVRNYSKMPRNYRFYADLCLFTNNLNWLICWTPPTPLHIFTCHFTSTSDQLNITEIKAEILATNKTFQAELVDNEQLVLVISFMKCFLLQIRDID